MFNFCHLQRNGILEAEIREILEIFWVIFRSIINHSLQNKIGKYLHLVSHCFTKLNNKLSKVKGKKPF